MTELDCKIIRPSATYDGKQGFTYVEGLSAQSVGSQAICMVYLSIPPGVKANAHLHENHETAIYMLQGEVKMWYGPDLSQTLTVRAGEFLYIPAGMPHLPVNLSETEPAVCVLARTDPNEQESVVLLPELEAGLTLSA